MKFARLDGDGGWIAFDGHSYHDAAIAIVASRYEQYEHTFGVGINVQVKDPDAGVIMNLTVTPHVEYSVAGLRGGE